MSKQERIGEFKRTGGYYNLDFSEFGEELNYVVNDKNNVVAIEPIIIVDKFFLSMEKYESYIDVLTYNMKWILSESKEKLQTMYIVYKFNMEDRTKRMSMIEFLFNLIMWRPYIQYQIFMDDSAIFDNEEFNNRKYDNYFNVFSEKHRDLFTAAEYSEVLYWVQVYMNKVVVTIGPLFGNSISIFDMVKLAKRNAEINAIIHTEVDTTSQPREVEEFLIGQTDRLYNLIRNESDKNNSLKPFIRAGVGVQKTQVCESFINMTLKPSLDGETIPIVSNTSLIREGMNNPVSIYIDGAGGRKAAIIQRGVASAGYFSRNATYATSDITLSDDPMYSCDTDNLYKTTIHSKRELLSFEGRFYKVGDKKYKVITSHDEHLINTEVELRSPATCGCKDGKICKTCYGTLYNVNYGVHIGLYASISLNESGTQIQLSARHALTTFSLRVELIDEKMFLITDNSWLFRLNDSIDRDKYDLVFRNNDVSLVKKDNYDKSDNYYIHNLVFRNKETKEEFEVYEASDCSLYLSSQLFRRLDKHKYFSMKSTDEEIVIPLIEIDTTEPLVFLRISNKELAAPIKKLKKFIQTGKKPLEDVADYNEFIFMVNELYRSGGIDVPSVHVEVLLRNLIRDVSDEQKIPDWTVKQSPENYKLTSLNGSIIANASVLTGLLFEQQDRQLRTPATYRKKKSSMHSLLFINE